MEDDFVEIAWGDKNKNKNSSLFKMLDKTFLNELFTNVQSYPVNLIGCYLGQVIFHVPKLFKCATNECTGIYDLFLIKRDLIDTFPLFIKNHYSQALKKGIIINNVNDTVYIQFYSDDTAYTDNYCKCKGSCECNDDLGSEMSIEDACADLDLDFDPVTERRLLKEEAMLAGSLGINCDSTDSEKQDFIQLLYSQDK